MVPLRAAGLIRFASHALAGAAWLAIAAAALAQEDYRAGRDAYDAGRYTDAARIWIPLATGGDLRAQFGLAILYSEGNGVPQDQAQAAFWFAHAAEQGLPAAQFNLGNAYHHGRGVPHDEAQAARWWTLAAEQGFAPAQFNLGTQYLHGRGVARDEDEALAWYRRAAANGHPRALQILAQAPPATEPAADTAGRSGESRAADPGRASTGFALNGPDWLLAQEPERYTLQLVALSERPRIAIFVHDHRLEGELAVFGFERDRVRYYALLYGIYPDRAAARSAVAGLPLEVQAARPWPRPLAAVQEMIRAGRAQAASE